MQVITIPNFWEHQHYHTKRGEKPPWIKLKTDIIYNEKIQQLKDNERWIFVALMCLAARHGNEIPADFSYIARNCSEKKGGIAETIIRLKDLKLIAIKRIARSKQNTITDKIREDKIREEESSSFKKRYYKGQEMRVKGVKLFVIPKDGGPWLEFTGQEKDIEYK